MISEQVENRIVLNMGLQKLKQDMGFDQLRFYCRKKSVGRSFHIMTNNDTLGRNAVRSIIEKYLPQAKACGSFTVLPDDTSVLPQNCAKWGFTSGKGYMVDKWGSSYGKPRDDRLYDKIAFMKDPPNTHNICYLPTKGYNCDDNSPTVSAGDKFEIYVR